MNIVSGIRAGGSRAGRDDDGVVSTPVSALRSPCARLAGVGRPLVTAFRGILLVGLWGLFLSLLGRGFVFAQNQTIGPGSCGVGKNNCHAAELPNMVDKHQAALDNMMESNEVSAYAEKSGIDVGKVLIGNNVCMKCHGTVISGKEGKEAEEGVSCEGCHGPGSAYKDPHKERRKDEKKGDPNRSGYVQSLQLGLVDLKNTKKRAEACVRCHYVTDQKVLASGHPSGEKFNYAAGMKSVAKHWATHPLADADKDKAPFEAAKTARGPLPIVASIKKQAPPPSDAPAVDPSSAAPAAPSGGGGPLQVRTIIKYIQVPASPPSPAPLGPVDLPEFPKTEGKKLDEILLLMKERIELLHEKTR